MKKNKYIILTFILFLLNIETTSAACTQEEINTFKRIENDYTVKYEIDKSTKTYNLYFTSTMPDKYYYLIYTNTELNCSTVDDKTLKCLNFQSGEYEILIVGVTNTCNDILKTINLKLPKYNKLADDPLCEGIEEFVLCNPAYDKEIDYDSFVSRVETYKKNHTSTEIEEEEPKDEKNQEIKENLNKITNYLKEHWIEITIIAVFIVLVLITIVITAKSIRKSRYLE